ncbi:Uncharacterised protein [Yersinia wautersii]|uniref:Uncharacterized protein n=1 Tax=Yersinia wautersii TaxID=1341643 RepID=A0ABP1ZE63_9GAMM|nr:Uncharacterised protein [Yersinia wautersii]
MYEIFPIVYEISYNLFSFKKNNHIKNYSSKKQLVNKKQEKQSYRIFLMSTLG